MCGQSYTMTESKKRVSDTDYNRCQKSKDHGKMCVTLRIEVHALVVQH